MNIKATDGHIWVWTKHAEEKAKEYGTEPRLAGFPADLASELLGQYAPDTWVEKGYVEQQTTQGTRRNAMMITSILTAIDEADRKNKAATYAQRNAEYRAEAASAKDALEKFWAGSASASIQRDIRAGRVVTLKAKD